MERHTCPGCGRTLAAPPTGDPFLHHSAWCRKCGGTGEVRTTASDEAAARAHYAESLDDGIGERPVLSYPYPTYEEARQGLTEALLDVAGNMGEEAVEAGYNDIVRSIAASCPPAVAAELLRREGVEA